MQSLTSTCSDLTRYEVSLPKIIKLNFIPQYHNLRQDVRVAAADLLSTKVPGKITIDGIRENVSTCLAYTAAWVDGNGCIPLNYLMEDAATAEITRVQLWQWVKYGARAENGQLITPEYIDGMITELGPGVRKLVPNAQEKSVKLAEDYLKIQIRRQWPSDFLTSDLMPNLAIADGVEPQYQKAQL